MYLIRSTRLLFGLEVLPINQSQLNLLSKFHVNTLKLFKSLPTRTATCAVHLLLGALPIATEIYKSKKEGKDQESIQSSATSDPGHRMGK